MPARCASADQRGFALFAVTMMAALLGVTAMLVFADLIHDVEIWGWERRGREARAAAAGGIAEVLNDRRLPLLLPKEPGKPATVSFDAPADSPFVEAERGGRRRAEVTLVRTAPLLESSQRRVRAVLYELTVSSAHRGGGSSDVEAVIYQVGLAPEGEVEVHGR